MGKGHDKLQSGFTLVELLIVMFIFAVGLTIMTPYFYTYVQDLNLRTAAREIMSDIYWLKAKASSENLNYRIDFNADANSYTIMRENGAGTNSYSRWGSEKSLSSFGSGIKMQEPAAFGNDSNLSIRTRGTLEPGHLILVNDHNTSLRINTVITGRVYVTKTSP